MRPSVGWHPTLSQALAAEFDAVGIVDQTVEDRVGEGRIAEGRRLSLPISARDLENEAKDQAKPEQQKRISAT